MGSIRLIVLGLTFCLLYSPLPSVAKKKKKLEITTVSKSPDCNVFAEPGDSLTVHYTGSLENGKVFDSSRQRQPFTIKLGAGQVIKGWDEGLVGMCEGEERMLKIPSHLAYGETGVKDIIPGGATLVFSVELLELTKPSLFKIPMGKEFWTYALLLALAVILGYELWRRYMKESEEQRQQKKSAKDQGGKRGKKKK